MVPVDALGPRRGDDTDWRLVVAKGLTNQLLTIWVAEPLYSHPAILELMAAGHRVLKLSLPDADLILAPQARYFTEDMIDYLPAALKSARVGKRKK